MTAPYILVFAHPRSGSTYLMDLLESLDGVVNLGELFHRNPATEQTPYRALALAPHGGDSHRFVNAARENPMAALKFLDDIPEARLFVIKVLGHQLASGRAREVLIRNAAGIVILRRNIFAAWTSRALVSQSRAWVNNTTSDFLVTFDRESFATSARTFSTHMAEFARLTRESGKPTVTMSYSELELIDSPQNLWRRIARSIPGLPELTVTPRWKPSVTRQDTRLPIDRVSNREAALAALTEWGLGYLVNNNDTDDVEHIASIFGRSRWQKLRRQLGLIKK